MRGSQPDENSASFFSRLNTVDIPLDLTGFAELGDLLAEIVRAGLSPSLPQTDMAICPLLDLAVELFLELKNCFHEGNRTFFPKLNDGTEEVLDTLFKVAPDVSAAISQQELLRNPQAWDGVARIRYNEDFSNWALHRIVRIPNPALRNEQTAEFFGKMAEVLITIKRCKGAIPRNLSRVLEEITPNHRDITGAPIDSEVSCSSGQSNRKRNKRNRRRESRHN